ncbi:MAG: head-tail connector protein [Rhodovibrio sp.]|nr:head-tail connector protein [Rhodovibrio sp.]
MLVPTLEQISGPASEPVSLADAKTHLRVDSTAEDTLIEGLIAAARAACENHTGRQLMQAGWRLTLDWFPHAIEVPRPPLVSVDAVKYTGFDGSEQTLAASEYKVAASEYGEIWPAYSKTWPDIRAEIDAVRVEFTAGYADADSVPAPLKTGIKMLVAHWYEHRVAVSTNDLSEVPFAVKSMWNPYADPRGA